MKIASNILAVLLILAGGTFALQGLNVLLGSYMSGRSEWLVIGLIMVVIGLGLLLVTNRPSPKA
jgi:hypothetical protein